METITIYIGEELSGNAMYQDNTRPVEFVGEKLAQRTTHGEGRHGGLDDTRGVTETLYRTEDGRLIVHVKDWSRWQGEPTIYTLAEITAASLQPNGPYEMLGREAGFGRSLTIDEALGN